jgi:tRNA(fMet)-specific endonuclease VapC
MKYLLDTDTCIYLINGKPPQVLNGFRRHRLATIGLSSIVVSELCWGVAKSGSKRNAVALEAFVSLFQIVDYNHAAALEYGQVRADLEQRGVPIGPLDLLIAAQALALDVTLVTNNEREFKRVRGLRLENWATA